MNRGDQWVVGLRKDSRGESRIKSKEGSVDNCVVSLSRIPFVVSLSNQAFCATVPMWVSRT